MAIAKTKAEEFADKVMGNIPVKVQFYTEGELRALMTEEIHSVFLPDDIIEMRKKYPAAFARADSLSVEIFVRAPNSKRGWYETNVSASYIACDINKDEAKTFVKQVIYKQQKAGWVEFVERKTMRENLVESVLALGSWGLVRQTMPDLIQFIPAPAPKKQLPAAEVNSVVVQLLKAGLRIEAA